VIGAFPVGLEANPSDSLISFFFVTNEVERDSNTSLTSFTLEALSKEFKTLSFYDSVRFLFRKILFVYNNLEFNKLTSLISFLRILTVS